jgi:RNA polymerase sigma factor (sigma-70 family)
VTLNRNDKDTVAIESSELGADDAKLVRRCQRGDQTAWNELVDRYQRLIYAVPRRAGLSEEQAADVFQEVFVTLLEKIDDIREPEKIRSWIVTTAKFKTWGIIRGTKEHYGPATEEEMEAEMAAIADESPLADQMLIEERCQTILSMIYLCDPAASYAEVAAAIGVGETSISPLRTRCLKKLEKVLAK